MLLPQYMENSGRRLEVRLGWEGDRKYKTAQNLEEVETVVNYSTPDRSPWMPYPRVKTVPGVLWAGLTDGVRWTVCGLCVCVCVCVCVCYTSGRGYPVGGACKSANINLLPFLLWKCCISISLTFWRWNNYFLILAHPVYKMWIIQEPNTLELWNKLHFEKNKTENIYRV